MIQAIISLNTRPRYSIVILLRLAFSFGCFICNNYMCQENFFWHLVAIVIQ